MGDLPVHRREPHQLRAELLDLMETEIEDSTRDRIGTVPTANLLEAGWQILHDSPDPFERDLARAIERDLQDLHPGHAGILDLDYDSQTNAERPLRIAENARGGLKKTRTTMALPPTHRRPPGDE